jgi:hypothetical protein
MPTRGPITVEATSVSEAWINAFDQLVEPGVDAVSPLIVTMVLGSADIQLEQPAVKRMLDVSLRANGEKPTDTVASTIFPSSMWNRVMPRQSLFDRYLRVLPRLKAASPANRYGLYFERMIHWPYRQNGTDQWRNQLDHIIRTYQGDNHRRSALQVAIFDPSKDHTHQRQRGFPCLQQIAFQPDSGAGTLSLTGVYALQNIYEKAYGNYLGLCHLGEFIGQELELHLVQVNCIASTAVLGDISKSEARQLLQQVHAHI